MNRERLAAKAAMNVNSIKRRNARDKQTQEYLDQLSGLSTEGWSEAHRSEFNNFVNQARSQIMREGANVNWGPIADGLMRMQDIGNKHAKDASVGRVEYESYMDPNSPPPEGETWDNEIIYDKTGYDQRLTTFNNVGLIDYNYNTSLGYFPNQNWEPGDPEEHKTIKGLLLSQGGTETTQNGKEAIRFNNQVVPVQGGAFDVSQGGFGGLWNGDIRPRQTIAPGDAFLNFKASGGGSSIFTTLANEYKGQVTSGEMTGDEAHEKLKQGVLTYLMGQDPSPTLQASAIKMWEDKYKQSWATVQQHEQQTNQQAMQETPYSMYAEAVANEANLKPKPAKSGSGSWTTQHDLWNSVSVNKYMGMDPTTTVYAIEDKGIKSDHWDDMLGANLGGDFGG